MLEFVGSEKLESLAELGTSCPDHFLRTKIRPLVLFFDPARESAQDLLERLPASLEGYRAHYAATTSVANTLTLRRCGMRMRWSISYLASGCLHLRPTKPPPGSPANSTSTPSMSCGGRSRFWSYRGLPEQEAFDIEYWDLEEAKLQRMPKPKALAGRIALITGGAGGIGQASARRLLDEGACVVLCDIDDKALGETESTLKSQYGNDAVASCWVDVTEEETIADLFATASWTFGGIDICISNAGIASAAAVEDTSLELWQRNMDILSTGYFLISRAAFQLFKLQGIGGSIVFVGSKNALAASPGASAYCTAKASELHLARCLALEGAPFGIRVNVVNPDAVLRGSRIWQGEWAEQRAQQYKTTPDELEAVYRERSLLKRSVFPEDSPRPLLFSLPTGPRNPPGTSSMWMRGTLRRSPGRNLMDTIPPLDAELIARHNAGRIADLMEDYAALARSLKRRGLSIDTIKERAAKLRVGDPELGRRGRRHALCALSDRR